MEAEPFGSFVEASNTSRRLRINDKKRLNAAVAAVEVMNDPGKRQAVLRELRDEFGPDFDPARLTAGTPDSWAIVRSCIEVDGLHQLVEAIGLVGGETRTWRELADLVNRMIPISLLNPRERQDIERLLEMISAEIISRGLQSAGRLTHADPGVPPRPDGVGVLRWLDQAISSGHTDSAMLWAFLESVSHLAGNPFVESFHYAINAAAQMRSDGEYRTVRDICAALTEARMADSDPTPAGATARNADTQPVAVDKLLSDAAAAEDGDDDVKTLETATAAATPSPGPVVWGGVPPRNPFFAGRMDLLDEIRHTVSSHVLRAVLPQTLQGLAGVGKSQVTIEFCHQRRADYDLVWWVPANDELSIRRSLVSLARRIGVAEEADAQFTIDAVLDALRRGLPYARWLVVFDDAAEPDVVRPYLPDGPGQVLITSRSRSWAGSSTIVEVDVFRPEESIAFLRRRWTGISDADAITLADRLGHLPLALDQAVAVHEQTGMPLAEYVDIFDRTPTKILDESIPTEYPTPVAKTWRLAFDTLSDNAPDAAQLLQLCSFLSSHPISVPMLREGRGATLPDGFEKLRDSFWDELRFRKAVQEIGKYALARLDPTRDFIIIHTLVRTVLQAWLPPERGAAVRRSAHEVLALANPGSPDRQDTWSRHARMAPHVLPSGVISSPDARVRQVVMDQIRYYFATGDFVESGNLATRAVQVWTEILDENDEMLLRAKFHLGNALRVLGEYVEARDITRDAFERLKQVFGPDHPYTLQVANSVTADLRVLGDFQLSRQLDEENLRRHRSALGSDDPSTLRAANNLAVDYRLLGLFSQARTLDEEVLRGRRIADPQGVNPETLLSVNNLVRDLFGLGAYAEGLQTQSGAMRTFERALRPTHRQMLLARRNIAVLLRKAGKYAQALQEAEKTFAVAQAQLGPSHELVLALAGTLFNTLRIVGDDLVRAGELAENTYLLYRERLGDEHPATLACAVNVAAIRRAGQRHPEAIELDGYALDALTRVLGADHQYTLCAALNMTNNLSLQGNHAEARKRSEDVFARSRRVRGATHPTTLSCAANLALDLAATGSHKEAQNLRDETLQEMKLQLGPEHPETVHVERGRRTEAEIEVPPM